MRRSMVVQHRSLSGSERGLLFLTEHLALALGHTRPLMSRCVHLGCVVRRFVDDVVGYLALGLKVVAAEAPQLSLSRYDAEGHKDEYEEYCARPW